VSSRPPNSPKVYRLISVVSFLLHDFCLKIPENIENTEHVPCSGSDKFTNSRKFLDLKKNYKQDVDEKRSSLWIRFLSKKQKQTIFLIGILLEF
jgi:hypothetical protein